MRNGQYVAVSKRKKPREHLLGKPPGLMHRIGLAVAEDDNSLPEYYVGREYYVDRALDRRDPATFFMGPKGVGKSAILQMVRFLKANERQRLVEIAPDDLAFSSLANVTATTPIMKEAEKNQFLFKCLWDYVLVLDLLRREQGNEQGLLSTLKALFKGKPNKEAQRLLKASISDDGSPQSMTARVLALISEVELSGPGGVGGKVVLGPGQVEKGGQLALLAQLNHVAKELPGTLRHPYYVIIDDLDLHWTDGAVQNALIAALFTSIRKLSRTDNLKFVVALRDDIFNRLPIEDRDKTHDRICRVRWDAPTLKAMIRKRVSYALKCSENDVWSEVLPRGAFDQMRQHTRGMPRELVRLTAIALEIAQSEGHGAVYEQDVNAAIIRFSQERLADLDERRHVYRGLPALMLRFRGHPKQFPVQDFVDLVQGAVSEVIARVPATHSYSWIGGYADDLLSVAKVLLECGVLQVKMSRTDRPRDWDPEDPIPLSSGTWLAIHPMYAPALAGPA